MAKTTFEFENGKYVIVRDDTTYETEVFRHDEPWDRDLTGDKLIHAMLNEIERLREYEHTFKDGHIEGWEKGYRQAMAECGLCSPIEDENFQSLSD